MVDGVVTPLYDQIVGYKVVWTEAYGIYVLTRPQITGDGVKEVKQVTGYSLEYLREKKQLFLEEGLYKFWNIYVEQQDTILGRIAEMFPGWSVSCSDTKLIDTYRYFDQLDVDALGFCYNDVAEKFHCIIAFDVYSKTIHAFDANTSLGTLPIYLSFENLVQSVDVTELTDEIKTKLHVYGADDLSIASVNPTGTDYIVDLSFFVERGDLDIKVGDSTETLEEKYSRWQNDILSKQELYSNLVASKSALSLQKLMLEAEKSELDGELQTHKIAQNVEIQAVASTGSESTKGKLNELAGLIKDVEAKIEQKNAEIEEIEKNIADANEDIQAVVDEFKMSNYFSPAELAVLEEFLIEGDIVEETFVASDVDASVDGTNSSIDGRVVISDAQITKVDVKNGDTIVKTMYGFAGGKITFKDVAGAISISIPPGRMKGDLTGDGSVDLSDSLIINSHIKGQQLITDETQLLLADTDRDGDIDEMDMTNVVLFNDSNMLNYRKSTAYDTLGNWNVNEAFEVANDPLFYTDITVPSLKAGDSIKVVTNTEYPEGFFTGECVDGVLRVYAKLCPITEVKVIIKAIDGDGVVTFEYDENLDDLLSSNATIVRGTMEVTPQNNVVLSMYLGTTLINGKTYENGTLTLTGILSSKIDSDIKTGKDENGITETKGTYMSFSLSKADASKPNAFLSVSTNEYKTISVARNLFDYGVESLAELATPTYEFSIDSTNFLFLSEFERFKDELELGKGIYLNLASEGVITPNVIGVGVDFTRESKLDLTFSNRYKKKNGFKTLESMIKKSYSSGRDFDASKYIIGKTVNQASNVSAFMDGNFESAKNAIIGAQDQSVVIDGAGISVTNTSKPDYQLRIVNGMIAMTKDGWKTSDVAIGYFNSSSETSDKLGGVNAQLLAGKLIIGNNLVIENNNADGTVKQFKVDGSGAWLNNSTFILQKGDGQIVIDPETGIAAGKNVFDLNATKDGVTASLYKEDSTSEYHDDIGFHLDVSTGNAYFRGTVMATSGEIGGWKIGGDNGGLLTSGSGNSYVAMSSSVDDSGNYAIWAGGEAAASAPFSVDRNGNVIANKLIADGMKATNADFSGTINATSGSFSGTINAANIGDSGSLSFGTNNYGGTITNNGIEVKNADGKVTFKVSSTGDVTMAGSISWLDDAEQDLIDTVTDAVTESVKDSLDLPVGTLALYHRGTSGGAPAAPSGAYDTFSDTSTTSPYKWHKVQNSSLDIYVSYSVDGGVTWGPPVSVPPSYIKSGYINKAKIVSPNIIGGLFYATGQGTKNAASASDPTTVAAYYISNGVNTTNGDTTPNTPIGWLAYDTGGIVANGEAQNRIVLESVDTVPIKLISGTNMSFECNNGGSIYFNSKIKLTPGVGYMKSSEFDPNTTSGSGGQIMFVYDG